MSMRTVPSSAARRASSLEGVLRAGVRAREAPTGMLHATTTAYTPGFVLITWAEIDLSNANDYSKMVSGQRGGGILVPTSKEIAETSGKTFTSDDLNILGLQPVPNTETDGWVKATSSRVARNYTFYVHEFKDYCADFSGNINSSSMHPCETECTKYLIWVDLGDAATPPPPPSVNPPNSMHAYIKEQVTRQTTEPNNGNSRAGDGPTLSNDEAGAMMDKILGGGGGGGKGDGGGDGGGKRAKWNGYGGGKGRGRGSYRGGKGGWRGRK